MTMREQLLERVGKGHLSYSSLKYALGDMRLWEMYMRGQLKKESDALTFGTLYDMLLFEPEQAREKYVVFDKTVPHEDIMALCSDKVHAAKNPKLTKEYKELKAKFDAGKAKEMKKLTDAGKEIVSDADWKRACEMIIRLEKTGLKQKYLTGKVQVEFNEEIDGVPVRGFLDCLQDNNEFIVDSKSARSIAKFRYDIKSWDYDIQAYIYTTVFGIKDYYWVAQEKTYPYYPALVKCSEETLFSGEMKFKEAVSNIKRWLANDTPTDLEYAEFTV